MNLVLQYILKKIYKPSIPIIKLNGLITETSYYNFPIYNF